MTSAFRIFTIMVMVATGALLSGCREEEQGRLLSYEKGVYLGVTDTELTDEQVRGLAHHTTRQGG